MSFAVVYEFGPAIYQRKLVKAAFTDVKEINFYAPSDC